jgi:hypothetical protein
MPPCQHGFLGFLDVLFLTDTTPKMRCLEGSEINSLMAFQSSSLACHTTAPFF